MGIYAHAYKRALYPQPLPSRSPRYLSDDDIAWQLDTCSGPLVQARAIDAAGRSLFRCAVCGWQAWLIERPQAGTAHTRPEAREEVSV